MRAGNAWPRRRFLKAMGVSTAVTLVLAEGPFVQAGGASAGSPCAYGSGLYGAGVYSGSASSVSPSLLLGRSSDDLLLSWSGVGVGTTYEVWRSDQPFVPGDPGSTLIATVTGTSYVDPGALASSSDLYYVTRGVPTCE